MPKTGDVIENPITTDRIIFRKTRQDTNGELLQFDNYHKPGGIGPNPHFHPLREETSRAIHWYSAVAPGPDSGTSSKTFL